MRPEELYDELDIVSYRSSEGMVAKDDPVVPGALVVAS